MSSGVHSFPTNLPPLSLRTDDGVFLRAVEVVGCYRELLEAGECVVRVRQRIIAHESQCLSGCSCGVSGRVRFCSAWPSAVMPVSNSCLTRRTLLCPSLRCHSLVMSCSVSLLDWQTSMLGAEDLCHVCLVAVVSVIEQV